MSEQANINELLRQGIEAAREGNKTTARELFEQVVDLDENNEKGWFWLASVVDTDEEKRICLSNVLHINPANERAQQALDALNAKQRKAVEAEEVIPGVTRRQLTLILGGGALVMLVIVIAALVVVTGNNNRAAAETATAAAFAAERTSTAAHATSVAVAASETAVSVAATQTATVTPASPTPFIATLPPTWTPRPAGGEVVDSAPTLPPPEGLVGRLVVWSGRDELNEGFLPIGYYQLDAGNVYTRIGDRLGTHPTILLNGQRVVYARRDPLLFSTVLEALNTNGTQVEGLQERWRPYTTVLDPAMPMFSVDGRWLTFVGRPQDRTTAQVYLLDMNAPTGQNPIQQLTNDDFDHSYPVVSPDGTRVAVVRADNFSATPGTDIVVIDVATGGKIPVTNDLGTYIETTPRWTPDGQQIVYAAAPSNDLQNRDIFVRNANGTGTPQPLITSPADDFQPVLSEDGRYVAFASNRMGGYDIFIYDVVSQELFQLTNSPEEDYPGDWWQP